MTLPRKRPKPRKRKSEPCTVRGCKRRPEIQGICVTHAMQSADRAFSLHVRLRDSRCTAALILDGECKGMLQAAHIVGRRNYAVRYDEQNVHALCAAHHYTVDQHGREAEKYEWAASVLGDVAYEALMERALLFADRRAAIAEALARLAAPSTDLDTPEGK